MSVDDRSPQDQVFQTIVDFWTAQAVHAAARLGLADHLAERPRSAAELAASTRTHAPSLARLLRALAAAGLLRESAGRYSLTPFGEALRAGTPGSLRPLVLWALGGEHYRAWGSLLHSIETWRTAFDHVYGQSVWDYYARHLEEAAVFNDAMTAGTDAVGPAVLEAFDFSPYRTVVIEAFVPPGGGEGPPAAVHRRQEKLFLVVEGQVEFSVRGDRVEVAVGGTAYAPRAVPHRFVNVGPTPARVIIAARPASCRCRREQRPPNGTSRPRRRQPCTPEPVTRRPKEPRRDES
jgi:mannose-6-phosphate isomerase-like protein (cupin superfamily)